MKTLIGREELHTTVRRLGHELSAAYGDGVLLVAVLKGSVLFLADLIRAMTVEPEVDFLAISAFAPDTGRVRIVKDLEVDLYGRDVVLVEDIVDTGLTLSYLLGELERRGPRSLEVCALLDKEVRRIVPAPIRFRGFAISEEFVVGYGLDIDERGRNLDEIVVADASELT